MMLKIKLTFNLPSVGIASALPGLGLTLGER